MKVRAYAKPGQRPVRLARRGRVAAQAGAEIAFGVARLLVQTEHYCGAQCAKFVMIFDGVVPALAGVVIVEIAAFVQIGPAKRVAQRRCVIGEAVLAVAW